MRISILLSLFISSVVLFGAESVQGQEQQMKNQITAEASRAFEKVEALIGEKGYSTQADAADLAWGESYILMAYVAMYEGTGNEKYLRRVIEHVDHILTNRDDKRNIRDEIREKVMASWSTKKYTKDKQYCWLVHAGMITYPVARFVYLVKKTPSLQKEFANKAKEYEKTVIETVNAFDENWRDGPAEGEGYYFGRYLGRALPLNQQNAMGRTLVALWLATGETRFKTCAARLATYFKNRLRKSAKRYVWSYWGDDNGAEDISHAAINVDFAFQCYRAQIVFDKTDMMALVQTFKHFARGKDGFARNVDGSGDTSYSPQAGRWVHLAYIDPEVRKISFDYFKNNWGKGENAAHFEGIAGLITSAHIVETARDFEVEEPILKAKN